MEDPDNAGVIAPPPLIFLTALTASSLLTRIVDRPFLPERFCRVCGLGCIAAGAACAGSAAVAMRRHKTSIDPYEPTAAVVQSGIFARTRNPIYLGMIAAYVGVSLLQRSLLPLVGLTFALPMIERGVIAREERYLERRFGDAYRTYREAVPRWL